MAAQAIRLPANDTATTAIYVTYLTVACTLSRVSMFKQPRLRLRQGSRHLLYSDRPPIATKISVQLCGK